ncbi:GNAT family N-acetyltransferase [Streptomyces orinoci]|uniref:GNAT family N-acetyltransferase n=1 Tax=Streptomyces orinoci TaxID=67339 RepID=A0ABV3K6R4_STRON|nr:GNAT family N-acetyltransferase [Streptomyces orinoci]
MASPDISQRNRIAVKGDPADAVPLVRHVLDEVGPAYRPFGQAPLIEALARQIPGLAPVQRFFWMETTSVPKAASAEVRWLTELQAKQAAPLFDHFFPDSYAQPGRTGVRRWAGVLGTVGKDAEPQPLAVAADAWSGAGCGFMAGICTHPATRGRGLARSVSGFVAAALVRRYGRAALMVDTDNVPAIAVYERLGMTKHLMAATGFTASNPLNSRASSRR